MTVNFRVIANKKYIWDGKLYEDEGAALNIAAFYKKDGFEVQLVEEDGKRLIYTRRIAAATVETN